MSLLPHQIKILKDRWHWDQPFDELCSLIARHIAEAEETLLFQDKYQREFFEILHSRKFSPNTPTWTNAGRDWKGSLSACFVYNIEDSMESILDSSRWMGMVQKFGGGTGFDLSVLRARGTNIKSTHGKACGPIAVLKYLAATSQMITQGGVRDGANMAVLSIYHPDVLDFINLKARESKFMLEIPRELAQQKIDKGEWTIEEGNDYIEYCRLNGLYQLFNISVAVDTQFMHAVDSYERSKRDGEPTVVEKASWSYNKILPCNKTIAEIWDIIVEQAHASGDPGLLFMDRAKAIGLCHSPLEIRATNPCGEQYLPHNGSCNLGSIDLSKFVKDPWNPCDNNKPLCDSLLPDEKIDWIDLGRVIQLAVRFLDNVVDVNRHADKGIDEVNIAERRIGLGVMGWADMLFKLGIAYDSLEALHFAEVVAEFFKRHAHQASIDLAKEKGEFPLYSQTQHTLSTGVQPMPLVPRRNATVTTIAPTGTISLVAGCSSGIEPHFLIAYEHQGLKEHGGLGLIWASETLKDFGERAGDLREALGTNEIETRQKFEDLIRQVYGWKPANEISIEWHIKHQAVWQKYIDNSISKTLNLANSATKQQVAEAYLLAYLNGCKGSTVYRDGCKPFQPLNSPKKSTKLEPESVLKDLSEVEATHILTHVPPKKSKRPRWVTSETAKIETAEGDLYITITHDDHGMPFEVFAQLGKGGTSTAAGVEALNRTISIGLRFGIHPYEYVRQLRGIKSTQYGFGPNAIFSVPDAIGQVLEEYMVRTFGEDWAAEYGWTPQEKDELPVEIVAIQSDNQHTITEACPKCGSQLTHAEGCRGGLCYVCGYSKCS